MTELYDAHCHPTDTISSIDGIASLEAVGLCIMATRESDQELVGQTAIKFSDKVIPAFGIHPWFVHNIYDDRNSVERPDKAEHFRGVIKPEPDADFIASLPDLVPLSSVLASISQNLEEQPLAMVGEVGVDKSFRIPDRNQPRQDSNRSHLSKYKTGLEHQSLILKAQLTLAGKYQRACSIHGVQAHGLLFDQISSLWAGHELPSKSSIKKGVARKKQAGDGDQVFQFPRNPFTSEADMCWFPPRICLHSFSGNRETVFSWINPRIPANIFFSFSQVVNGRYDRWAEVVDSIPDDRLLIESDYHDCRSIDKSLEEALQFVAQAKGWTTDEARVILKKNWHSFVYGTQKRETHS
ncbi:hypothetical protein BCR37DRAFT_390276 [Protomyces lactucae-debilis]|uniref:Cut9 interacting protein Scn1 n=1 Tax=Protomyces lactucae-debilis TaxID=2754530 RepID=A0A1Y2FUR8_PROLT|nr:uncharacterized protein BCR37DRAFT_390276 [Protomyces lactucae-debilis]ORY87750.1 hypothetical protein BCR37DRAFT_390276 [Protomyces lactucae-debilis]